MTHNKYFFKEKFHISELVPVQIYTRSILVAEPEEYLRQIYVNNLSKHGYVAEHCGNLSDVVNLVGSGSHGAMILSPHMEKGLKRFYEVVGYIREIRPSLVIITVGESLQPEILSNLMSLGVVSHLDRRFSRPKDIIEIINSVLKNH